MSGLISPRAGAFRYAGFRHCWIARFLDSFSAQVMGVSVGWQVCDLTRDPFDLAFRSGAVLQIMRRAHHL